MADVLDQRTPFDEDSIPATGSGRWGEKEEEEEVSPN